MIELTLIMYILPMVVVLLYFIFYGDPTVKNVYDLFKHWYYWLPPGFNMFASIIAIFIIIIEEKITFKTKTPELFEDLKNYLKRITLPTKR